MRKLNSTGNVVHNNGPKLPRHYRIAKRIVSELVDKEIKRIKGE